MSVPSRISARIGDAGASCSMNLTGRRLAKTPSAERNCRSPCSGLTCAFGFDHFGPPTAPSNIASLSLQLEIVLAGSGSPVASIAAPPMLCSLKLNVWPCREAMISSSLRPASVTSGPMPSPGRSVIRASRIVSPQNFVSHLRVAAGNQADRCPQQGSGAQKHRSDTQRSCHRAMSASMRRRR